MLKGNAGLLCLPCLVFGLAAGVPEIDDVDDVAIDTVHHLVQPIDDDAAVGQRTVVVERVNLSDARTAQELVDRVVNLLAEPLGTVDAKFPANICGDLPSTIFCRFLPDEFHSAYAVSS